MSNAIVHLLNGVDNNSLKVGIYSNIDNKMLTFGTGGKFISAGPISYKYSRIREIDLVSIINVGNEMEVAFVIDKQFSKYPVNGDINEIVKWFNTHPNLIFVGRKDDNYSDNQGSIGYIQYFFGFTKGVLSVSQMRGIFGING